MKKHRFVLFFNLFLWITLLFATNALSALITGTELYDSFNAPSTNALNYAKQVPGREGQNAPFVIFVSNGVGEVTLQFTNGYTGGAFFEYRLDHNVKTTGSPHPVVTGDFIYSGYWIPTPLASETHTLNATNMVEIRLALGGERDWDFDWTAFEAVPAPVPIPPAFLLLGSGLIGMVAIRRKIKR